MNTNFCAIIGMVLTFCGSQSYGQTFSGGDISLGYAGLTDSDLKTSGYALNASGEAALTRELSVQGDFGYTNGEIGGFDGDILSLAAHGIYNASENASFGIYVGQDSSDGDSIKFYGVEGGYGYNQIKVDGYFGVTAIDSGPFIDGGVGDVDLNQIGMSATFMVNDIFTVSGRYDRIRLTDAIGANRIGAGVGATLRNDFELAAEVGRIEGDVFGYSDNATYANVSATYSFGGPRGATFEQRGIAKTLLGF
ncbi:hypothetical protein [Loktanella sp. M215]|uniref:hypothetical protein n=1 Tax=Loktanella sp. M215 TaxID=2675431 RepID=UPI001F1FE13F|nr:hypothetical protein [Loktanella sp. M215]MCF7700509.1 hypothetical protein [Loktanella sp. M215]